MHSMVSAVASCLGKRRTRLNQTARIARRKPAERMRLPALEALEHRALLSTISGQKFHDVDGDGTHNGGTEPGLEGWVIELDADADGTVDATATTAADGTYQFLDLPAGTYRVREVLLPGWIQTTTNPTDIVLDGTNDVTGVDFGNFQKIGRAHV